MEDKLIQTVMKGIKFQEGIEYEEVTAKGISVKLPTRCRAENMQSSL